MIQRTGKHGSKACMPWGPAQRLQSARIGHDGIGITGSSIAQNDRYGVVGGLPSGLHGFLDAGAFSRPDVISAELTRLQTITHDRMGRHHVIHVDVIPNTCSIGGGVIRPKNREVLPPPLHHIKKNLAEANVMA